MRRAASTAWVYGLLAAALWSPHAFVVNSLRAEGVPALALQFHLLFWPAVACVFVLFITGRTGDLAVFKRRETRFLVLAALGGYGFWVLQALAVERGAGRALRLFPYAVPLMMGLLSLPGRERIGGRTFWALLCGLIGCALLVRAGAQGEAAVPLQSRLLGLGAAACWAIFSLAARPVVREERVLPVVTLVTCIGAACLAVTCVSTGEGLFEISPGQLQSVAIAGVLTVGLMMGCWLRCLAGLPAPRAGLLWYLGLPLGALVGLRYGWRPGLWWSLAGGVLILFALRGVGTGERRSRTTLGDVIRGS